METVVFGDVGGYADRFRLGLAEVGWDEAKSPSLPRDKRIVQVGDLIHKGPDSPGVLDLVLELATQENYVQLIGNHELMYLTPKQKQFWSKELNRSNRKRLRAAYEDGLLKCAYAFTDQGEDYLVTHAGLTYNKWKNYDCGNAYEIAETLNSLPLDDMTPSGAMYGVRSLYASPLWAEGVNEVCFSWERQDIDVPFNQIYGHSSPIKWSVYGNLYRMNYEPWFLDNIAIHNGFAVEWNHRGKRFISIDVDADKKTPFATIPGYVVGKA